MTESNCYPRAVWWPILTAVHQLPVERRPCDETPQPSLSVLIGPTHGVLCTEAKDSMGFVSQMKGPTQECMQEFEVIWDLFS